MISHVCNPTPDAPPRSVASSHDISPDMSVVVAEKARMLAAARPFVDITQDIDAVVEGIGAWDFDIFLADELSGGRGRWIRRE